MSYKIELTPVAEKALLKLAKGNRALVKKIDKTITGLAENPTPLNSRQLSGEDPPLYRVRIGDYRILYHIEDDVLVVLVVHVGHHKDVYRFLKR
jgi:mRNA interferase RelE/StbE